MSTELGSRRQLELLGRFFLDGDAHEFRGGDNLKGNATDSARFVNNVDGIEEYARAPCP